MKSVQRSTFVETPLRKTHLRLRLIRPTMCPVKTEKPNWKKIARRAAQERDPDKLLAIIEELNAALEARANERRARLYAPPGHRIGKRLLFVDDESSTERQTKDLAAHGKQS